MVVMKTVSISHILSPQRLCALHSMRMKASCLLRHGLSYPALKLVLYAYNTEERMLAGTNGTPEEKIQTFSKLELAQATAFIREVQRAEGGVIMEPMFILQFRYGIDYGRACALAEQLEDLGFWALFIGDNGMRCAQVLRG